MAIRVRMLIGESPAQIRAGVTGLAAIGLAQMEEHPLPLLYKSGFIHYRREKPGHEDWQTAEQVAATRQGDCEDLAAYRLAELHFQGEYGARIHVSEPRPRLFHIRVQRADGTIEDPSLRLGMRGAG